MALMDAKGLCVTPNMAGIETHNLGGTHMVINKECDRNISVTATLDDLLPLFEKLKGPYSFQSRFFFSFSCLWQSGSTTK